MATYYRWRKSTAIYADKFDRTVDSIDYGSAINTNIYISSSRPSILVNESGFDTSSFDLLEIGVGETEVLSIGTYFFFSNVSGAYTASYYETKTQTTITALTQGSGTVHGTCDYHYLASSAGEFISYVYSTDASAYPNGGVRGDYYYDKRTTITSPTAPTNLQYPNPITTPTVTVSWDAATSNVPSYSVSKYELSYALNGSGWKIVGTPSGTSLEVIVPTEATSIQFRVRAQDSNGQWSSYATGTASNILLSPTLTVPSMAMQGQQITVNWTAIDGATSYTLQRQANTDDGWVQVYSGNALTFTETVGTWTTVQYQVQAVFSVGPGGWGTSKVIPVVSASALVISGQDGDLGTLTADVPYTVSTDTGKPITVERKVNGQVVAGIKASSNFAYDIPIYDLPTGAGTITLTCSVTPEGQAPVQAERKWTYYKAPVLFPQTGSTAQITKEGKNVYPLTIAEAVRTPQYMGGSLDKTLELLEEILNTAVISVGTYVGTGTSGQSAPNRLRFMSPPTVVTVYGEGRVLSISNTEPTGGQADAYIQGNEAIWYNISADKQLNESGKTYTYFAAGKRV